MDRKWLPLSIGLAGPLLVIIAIALLLSQPGESARAEIAYVPVSQFPPAPVIDGQFTTPDEYAGATSDADYGAYPGQYGWFYVQNDATTLFMMNDFYVDNAENSSDYNVFRFDLDNSGTYEIEVDVYSDHIRVVSDSITLDPAQYATLGITATAGFGTSPRQPNVPHRLYELAIHHRGLGNTINFDPNDPPGPPGPPPVFPTPTPTPAAFAEWGDAPDEAPPSVFNYPTLPENTGASHVVIDYEWLGDLTSFRASRVCTLIPTPFEASIEAGPLDPNDPDGQSNLPWDNDDIDWIDGGVDFQSIGPSGGVVEVLISTSGQGAARYGNTAPISNSLLFLNAWFDANADGDWDDAEERLFWLSGYDETLFLINAYEFAMNPATWSDSCHLYGLIFSTTLTTTYGTWSRFRLDYGEDAGRWARTSPTLWDVRGEAQFGEVEDYLVFGHMPPQYPLDYGLLPAYHGWVTPDEDGAPILIRKDDEDGLCVSDIDCDGMYDGWEAYWSSCGLSPLDPSDAGEDADMDGRSNYEEFYHLTNPCMTEYYVYLTNLDREYSGGDCEPVHNAEIAWAPFMPMAGEEVTFVGSAIGSGPITYVWDFGDGHTGSGRTVRHSYAMGGAYSVVLVPSNACGYDMEMQALTIHGPR